MKIPASNRLQNLPKYPMKVINDKIAELRGQGVPVVDFGVGDPTTATPDFIQEAAIKAIKNHESSGYPSYIGMPEYREAASRYMKRRFDVEVDPHTEVCSTIGAKEAVFHFAEAYVNPGDYVLVPTPGYPPYKTGAIFAEGVPFYYGLYKENDFLPDFNSFPKDVLAKAKILWLNYPHNPTGKQVDLDFYKKAYEFCQQHNLILAADEPYADVYFDEDRKPVSALQVGKENVIVFQSLSKRSNMTGYRVGFVCGDADIIHNFRNLKTNIDSGTANFIQEAGIVALSDDAHCALMRQEYREKRDVLMEAFRFLGLPESAPDACMFIWQELPKGIDDIEFATKLLHPDIAVAGIPGSLISDTDFLGQNPGKGFIRFALVPSLEDVKNSAERIKKAKDFLLG